VIGHLRGGPWRTMLLLCQGRSAICGFLSGLVVGV
jgi:hypothetical protein